MIGTRIVNVTNSERYSRTMLVTWGRFRSLHVAGLTLILILLPYAPRAVGARAELSTTQLPWPVIGLSPLSHRFTAPVHITYAPGDQDRLFVVEKGSRIQIWQDGALLDPPFLDFGESNSQNNPVDSGCGECGLLSVAFPPDFATSGYFFVYYNSKADRIAPPDESGVVGRTKERNGGSDSVIARFQVHKEDPNQADLTSEKTILLVNQPYSNHNGGLLAFGPDGYLYLGLGDGGSGGDPIEAGQRLDTLLGKILRIDVSDYDAPEPYAIPDDNPFTNQIAHQIGAAQNVRPEIWAYGLRNPWRFSFDRATGDLYVGDVGQNQWEEIDFQPAASNGGENYGWDVIEGPDCYYDENDDPEQPCDRSGATAPILTYHHGLGCSITGGNVYRGPSASGLQGIYLYGDYCSGRIWGARQIGNEWQSKELLDTALNIVSFGEDQAGHTYVADIISGMVYRVLDISQQSYLPFIGS